MYLGAGSADDSGWCLCSHGFKVIKKNMYRIIDSFLRILNKKMISKTSCVRPAGPKAWAI